MCLACLRPQVRVRGGKGGRGGCESCLLGRRMCTCYFRKWLSGKHMDIAGLSAMPGRSDSGGTCHFWRVAPLERLMNEISVLVRTKDVPDWRAA